MSMLLTVVLIMSAFVTPVAAGQGNGRGQEQELRGQGSRLILSESLLKEMKNLICWNSKRVIGSWFAMGISSKQMFGLIIPNICLFRKRLLSKQNSHLTKFYMLRVEQWVSCSFVH